MTSTAESKPDVAMRPIEDGLPMPIAQMIEGGFWTRRSQIPGLTREECEAFQLGTLPPERAQDIKHCIEAMRIALHNAPVPGVQMWMTTKRIMS